MRQFISLSFMILVLFTSIVLADSVQFRNGDQVEGVGRNEVAVFMPVHFLQQFKDPVHDP